jgi:hypothetical protein
LFLKIFRESAEKIHFSLKSDKNKGTLHERLSTSFFYVHVTVHLSNTSHINTNEMLLFYSLLFGVRTLHVSDAVCVPHQEYYKL